jgi:putative oxidoreductase
MTEYAVLPIGRLLLSAIFIMSGIHKITAWSDTADSMTREGMIAVPLFLLGAVVFEIAGGLSVLLGYWTRCGALLLIIFLIPTTIIFHDFWTYESAEQQMQMIHFMKNLAILGGLCFVLTYGPGPVSIDRRSNRQPK